MKLSVVIPAKNEEDCIEQTVTDIIAELEREKIEHEIIIADDNSTDRTGEILARLAERKPTVRVITREPPSGFGRAIRDGLLAAKGDVVATVMGDNSDDPRDLVTYFRKIEEGYDCAFGSRFVKGSRVNDYPPLKLFINRIANFFIMCLFLTKHNDITNAFKAYRIEVIHSALPILSLYYNITVELPLKAIIRGFSYATVPINWYGRESGVSKLKIREMSRKYLFITLYVWLEKILLSDEIKSERKNISQLR